MSSRAELKKHRAFIIDEITRNSNVIAENTDKIAKLRKKIQDHETHIDRCKSARISLKNLADEFQIDISKLEDPKEEG